MNTSTVADWGWWLGVAVWTAVVAVIGYTAGRDRGRAETQRGMIEAGWRIRVRQADGTEAVYPSKEDLDAMR